jgi:glycosyltransferase involved in cell wall biosynthesis
MSMHNELTVCLITYNHANYVQETLDSILAQKTSFGWNIHIYDDHSTDGTTDIVRRYAQRYPDKIKLVVQPGNVGAAENWKQLLQSATTPYLAYVEGDDYWVDEQKLEKQFALLQHNPSVGMVYAQAIQIYPGQAGGQVIGKALARHALYLGNPIPSPTVVMRTRCLDGFFDELGDRLQSWKMGDYPLWFYISAGWELAFIGEPMSAYRVLQNSATRSSAKSHWIRSKLSIRRYFYRKHGTAAAAPYYWAGTAMLLAELAYHRLPRALKKPVRAGA